MPDAAPQAPKSQTGAQPGVFNDPFCSYNFKVVIQGVTEGHFTQCSNIGMKIDAVAYREGGGGPVVHRIPAHGWYGDVTLRYGLTASRELWDWMMMAVKGKVQRKNISIVLMGPDGVTEVLRWDLVNAWPSSWRGAPLNALTSEVAVEELTLVYETLDRG